MPCYFSMLDARTHVSNVGHCVSSVLCLCMLTHVLMLSCCIYLRYLFDSCCMPSCLPIFSGLNACLSDPWAYFSLQLSVLASLCKTCGFQRPTLDDGFSHPTPLLACLCLNAWIMLLFLVFAWFMHMWLWLGLLATTCKFTRLSIMLYAGFNWVFISLCRMPGFLRPTLDAWFRASYTPTCLSAL